MFSRGSIRSLTLRGLWCLAIRRTVETLKCLPALGHRLVQSCCTIDSEILFRPRGLLVGLHNPHSSRQELAYDTACGTGTVDQGPVGRSC